MSKKSDPKRFNEPNFMVGGKKSAFYDPGLEKSSKQYLF